MHRGKLWVAISEKNNARTKRSTSFPPSYHKHLLLSGHSYNYVWQQRNDSYKPFTCFFLSCCNCFELILFPGKRISLWKWHPMTSVLHLHSPQDDVPVCHVGLSLLYLVRAKELFAYLVLTNVTRQKQPLKSKPKASF